MSATSSFRPSGGGAVQEHAHGCKVSPTTSWSPRAEGALPPSIPRMRGCVCNLALGVNGECFRPSLCLEWLPQVQGVKRVHPSIGSKGLINISIGMRLNCICVHRARSGSGRHPNEPSFVCFYWKHTRGRQQIVWQGCYLICKCRPIYLYDCTVETYMYDAAWPCTHT